MVDLCNVVFRRSIILVRLRFWLQNQVRLRTLNMLNLCFTYSIFFFTSSTGVNFVKSLITDLNPPSYRKASLYTLYKLSDLWAIRWNPSILELPSKIWGLWVLPGII
jgi:hypothetical protein